MSDSVIHTLLPLYRHCWCIESSFDWVLHANSHRYKDSARVIQTVSALYTYRQCIIGSFGVIRKFHNYIHVGVIQALFLVYRHCLYYKLGWCYTYMLYREVILICFTGVLYWPAIQISYIDMLHARFKHTCYTDMLYRHVILRHEDCFRQPRTWFVYRQIMWLTTWQRC